MIHRFVSVAALPCLLTGNGGSLEMSAQKEKFHPSTNSGAPSEKRKFSSVKKLKMAHLRNVHGSKVC